MQPADFDYELPDELIARFPPGKRRDSRLLVLDAAGGAPADSRFARLPEFLRPGDLLVFNDTRVIPARLRGRKPTGGRVEILIERILASDAALAQIGANKPLASGSRIDLAAGGRAEVVGRRGSFFELRFSEALVALLERGGEVPLPPYLARDAEPEDRERYQTVYAKYDGAVAAPTAGLHFDDPMLDETRLAGVRHAFVTLHVGAGTFKPLSEENLRQGRLHAERVRVEDACCQAVARTREQGGRVIAVGTTTVRALEAAAAGGELSPFDGDTELFITPGWRFAAVDGLVTNFHLPRSSLLMLVAAFGGRERVMAAYHHAVAARYRFFSYGDAMLVFPPRRPCDAEAQRP